MKPILRQLGATVKKAVLGDTLIPQEFTIGLEDPQTEISLWLHGIGMPRDVTERYSTACTAPLTICIAFDQGQSFSKKQLRKPVLKFCERGGQKQVLGELRLIFHESIPFGGSEFVLFRVQRSKNYCLPGIRLWSHYLVHAYSHWRRNDPVDMRMTLAEERAATVTFIRPHPLCLASLGDTISGNIFPMNLMGDLGNDYVCFALREFRLAAHLVERAGRVAISGVPLPQCSVPFQLAGNHKKESIDWKQLPFETKPSVRFRIPVPMFATRVREMQIEKVHKIGSHRLFIARKISDERHAAGLQACVVHGFYQFWRLKGDRARLKASVLEDSMNKRGL